MEDKYRVNDTYHAVSEVLGLPFTGQVMKQLHE